MKSYKEKVTTIHNMIHNKTGEGSDFLGWVDWPKDYDYEEVKNYLLSTIEKVDIYVGLDKYTPVKEVDVDGTIYHRIYWQVQSEREKSIYLSEPYPNTFYFFSYNSDLKYIAFSIAHSFEPIMFSDIDNLKRMIRLNFNYNF